MIYGWDRLNGVYKIMFECRDTGHRALDLRYPEGPGHMALG